MAEPDADLVVKTHVNVAPWLKDLTKISAGVVLVGITLFLLHYVVVVQSAQAEKMITVLEEQRKQSVDALTVQVGLVKLMNDHHLQTTAKAEEDLLIRKMICFNAAKDVLEKSACFNRESALRLIDAFMVRRR